MTADQIERSAVLSPCGTYRYRLARTNLQGALPHKGTVCWIMLNPSTADAAVDDPTIRRCIGYARQWGYGSIDIANLFAYRSTDPKLLLGKYLSELTGPDYWVHLYESLETASIVVAGWGVNAKYLSAIQVDAVRRFAEKTSRQLHSLATTKDGDPRHPLYLKADLLPKAWP